MNYQLDKLPKWAKEHIKDLTRQRDVAVNSLNKWADEQTPASFSVDELICTEQPPKHFSRYVQGYRMKATHLGIEIDVLLRDDCIDLSYTVENQMIGDVLCQPTSFQQFRLKPIQKGES